MGEVHKAYDTQRDRHVALKLLPAALSGDPEYIRRFQRESQVVARLTEPHIVPIHDFGELDGHLFIDMRLVGGTDIGRLLHASGPIAPPRAVHLVSQIADALDAAHADQLVHRDIKPSNVLVTPSDFVYVVDFGIARTMGHRQTALTVTGATIGTMYYMSPERFTGQDLDGRADVYSLACLLHECLTGTPPFNSGDLPALIYAQLYSTPPQASSLVAGIPPALDDVIARGMAKDPADRYPTAGQLAAAAREAVQAGAQTAPAEQQSTSWNGIPASAWVSATEAWQAAGPPQAPLPAQPQAPAPEPVGYRPAPGFRESPTQTVMAGSFDAWSASQAPETLPPGSVPPVTRYDPPRDPNAGGPNAARYPDGGAFPPGPPARGRRRAPFIVAGAAAVAAVVAIALVVSSRPKNDHIAPAANSSAGTRTAVKPASSEPGVAVPTIAQTLTVGQSPSWVAVAPNGKFAYVTDTGKRTVTVIDTASDSVAGSIPIPQGPPQFVSFSPDSRTAYVSVYNTRGSVHLIAFIDTATKKVTGTVSVTNHTPGPSTVNPDGRFLYVPNHNMSMTSSDGLSDIDVIDTSSMKLVDTITVKPNPHWVVFGPHGLIYVTNHMSGTVTVIDAHTNQVLKTIVVGVSPHSEALSPDGRTLAISSYGGNKVFLLDTATDKVVKTIPVGQLPLDIAYSPDGRYLYATDNDDGTVSVIDTATDRVITKVPTSKQPTSISVLPNGKQAYVTDEGDGTVEVLNLPK
jgi:serine/threonine-protein kinase